MGNDREHLYINPVEFIQTGPGSSGGQPRKQLLHHLIVDLVRTIKDHTELPKTLGQVFGALRLPSAGRPSWCRPEHDLERPRDGHPAPVRKGSDDQPGGGPQVLMAVVQSRTHLLDGQHLDGIAAPETLGLTVVIPELLLPLKLMDALDFLLDELLEDVPVVNILSNEGDHCLALAGVDLRTGDYLG